jgi:hypothetical protein
MTFKAALNLRLREATRIRIALAILTLWTIISYSFLWTTGQALRIEFRVLGFSGKIGFFILSFTLIWCVYQLLFVLYPHCARSNLAFWTKVMWFAILLAWPIGPLMYWLFVYRAASPSIAS